MVEIDEVRYVFELMEQLRERGEHLDCLARGYLLSMGDIFDLVSLESFDEDSDLLYRERSLIANSDGFCSTIIGLNECKLEYGELRKNLKDLICKAFFDRGVNSVIGGGIVQYFQVPGDVRSNHLFLDSSQWSSFFLIRDEPGSRIDDYDMYEKAINDILLGKETTYQFDLGNDEKGYHTIREIIDHGCEKGYIVEGSDAVIEAFRMYDAHFKGYDLDHKR